MTRTLATAWSHRLDDYPTALAVSRDGAVLAAGTARGTVFILDATSGDLLHTLAAHDHGVLALAFGRKTLAGRPRPHLGPAQRQCPRRARGWQRLGQPPALDA